MIIFIINNHISNTLGVCEIKFSINVLLILDIISQMLYTNMHKETYTSILNVF